MNTVQKLRITSGNTIRAIGIPENYESLLGELPEGVRFTDSMLDDVVAIHWLVRSISELEAEFPKKLDELRSVEKVWIIYPRKAKYQAGDANRDSIWQFLETRGWKAVANYPVGEEYSAVWAKPAV